MAENLPQLANLTNEVIARGENIATDVKSEDAIVWLLDVKKWADDTLAKLKSAIATKAVEADRNFSSARGDQIKVEYRAFGSEFALSPDFDESKDFDPAFMKREVVVKITPIASAIASYEKETGELPRGVVRNKREKQIIIKRLTP